MTVTKSFFFYRIFLCIYWSFPVSSFCLSVLRCLLTVLSFFLSDSGKKRILDQWRCRILSNFLFKSATICVSKSATKCGSKSATKCGSKAVLPAGKRAEEWHYSVPAPVSAALFYRANTAQNSIFYSVHHFWNCMINFYKDWQCSEKNESYL